MDSTQKKQNNKAGENKLIQLTLKTWSWWFLLFVEWENNF